MAVTVAAAGFFLLFFLQHQLPTAKSIVVDKHFPLTSPARESGARDEFCFVFFPLSSHNKSSSDSNSLFVLSLHWQKNIKTVGCTKINSLQYFINNSFGSPGDVALVWILHFDPFFCPCVPTQTHLCWPWQAEVLLGMTLRFITCQSVLSRQWSPNLFCGTDRGGGVKFRS